MRQNWIGILAVAVLVAACAIPAPDPRRVQIENTPGSAVIYLVRSKPDLGTLPAQVVIGDRLVGTTYPGTYYRVEVPAGRHRLAGTGVDTGALTLDTRAGGVYFVQQRVTGDWRAVSPHSFFSVIDEPRARAVMAYAERS